ncbi:efflux transporter outer membrane subunit [Rheinheimera sp.]|uniref:efflux transporter outer membrane subunit n=1 Tax=Rheinheimera sp. TaxID=1869214 RepID=UPI00307F2D0E
MRNHIRLTSLSLALAATLFGCASVGQPYQAPTTFAGQNLPQQYQVAEQASDWFAQLGDAELNRLIEQALLASPTLAAAKANADRAYAVFQDADNDDWARMDLAASQQNQQIPDSAAQNAGQIQRQASLGGQLSWDLDLFGKLEQAAVAANARAEAAGLAWQQARIALLSQVASSYGDYRGAELRLSVAEQDLQNLKRTKQIIQARRDAGVASDLELSRIDAQIYQQQAFLPALRQLKTAAHATLAALLAQSPQQLVVASQATPALPAFDNPVQLDSQLNYLQFRPEVAQAERELAASHADIGVATAELYPQLSLTGFLGFLASPGLSLGSANESWSIAPTLRWQATELSSIQARIRGAEASQQLAVANFQKAVFDALAQMQTAVHGYKSSRERELWLSQQVAATKQAVELIRAQYDAGTVEFLQLLDAERDWLQSRDAQAQQALTHYQQLVGLYQAFAGALPLADGQQVAMVKD